MNWHCRLSAHAIILFARLLTGMQTRWSDCLPEKVQRVYFANHSSHGDFVLIWGCLPPELRSLTRPVAGADYWNTSALRRFIGLNVFNALLIDRTANRMDGGTDPVARMRDALHEGASLILFPEGTRNTSDERLLPLKSGIYHLANACPEIEFIPVWIDNLNRVMPKGEIIPVPLLCTVTFGEPVRLQAGEHKETFLTRCRERLLSLAPAME